MTSGPSLEVGLEEVLHLLRWTAKDATEVIRGPVRGPDRHPESKSGAHSQSGMVMAAGATYALWGMSARALRGQSSHAVCASRSGAHARERGVDGLGWLRSV
jgi:hypothetical protein